MFDFTFLTKEQIINLNIFHPTFLKAPISDYAILLGGHYEELEYYKVNNDQLEVFTMDEKIGRYWTKTDDFDGDVLAVNFDGYYSGFKVTNINVGARLVIEYEKIKKYAKNKKEIPEGVYEVEFGQYPQTVAPIDLQEELNTKFGKGELIETNKKYTMNNSDDSSIFEPKQRLEYAYDNKKYVLVPSKNDCDIELSNLMKYKPSECTWVEVEPVKWIVFEDSGLAISSKILFAGLPFKNYSNYTGDFEETVIHYYLDKYFKNEIIPSSAIIKTEDILSNKLEKSYNFNYDSLTNEDLMKGSLESDIALFLHGKSSDGKSARVKQFDPDAEIVYLRNATPDSLNGKSVYNASTGEMIDVPPTWYKKLKEKCDAEPNKIHIVFFDELTNALPSIQGMAFNIILDKEVNGIWKLPKNARVVAAGNDLEDSLAANKMAEPLFNRFNHIYIDTTVDEWLSWAMTPEESYERLDYKETKKTPKIHPAIYAYITYKRETVLRTRFNGETPNADPRKWEMASKVLYKTNNPNMLKGLIGEDLTIDFIEFTKTNVITLEDVINGNYTDEIFKINLSEKYLTTLALSTVDYENLNIVLSFIENFGGEFVALFESLWTMGDSNKLEQLMNLNQNQKKIK